MDQAEATRERILTAAETLLRRHGPAHATVVDVARSLGMSHANVYRHFPSKAALRGAVAERWLAAISAPLDAIATGPEPAPARLATWLRALAAAKRRKVLDDPELFATYEALAGEAREVVTRHVAALTSQVARIVADGIAEGSFTRRDPLGTAGAVLAATLRFHHPYLLREAPPPPEALEPLLDLLLAGLRRPAG